MAGASSTSFSASGASVQPAEESEETSEPESEMSSRGGGAREEEAVAEAIFGVRRVVEARAVAGTVSQNIFGGVQI